MPAARLVALIEQVDEVWGFHEENTAQLLDVLSTRLDWTWTDRTTDPEDQEVKAALAKQKDQKPPPTPIIRPVAWRPRAVAEQRVQEYIDSVTSLGVPRQDKPASDDEKLALLAKWDAQNGFA